MRIPRGIATLVIIAAVVGSALLGQQRWRTESDTVAYAQTEQPGYSARNAELIETGADGRPLFRLDAEVIRQRSQDDSVDLDNVHMSYRGERSSQWALTAQHGTVREGNEYIELDGQRSRGGSPARYHRPRHDTYRKTLLQHEDGDREHPRSGYPGVRIARNSCNRPRRQLEGRARTARIGHSWPLFSLRRC